MRCAAATTQCPQYSRVLNADHETPPVIPQLRCARYAPQMPTTTIANSKYSCLGHALACHCQARVPDPRQALRDHVRGRDGAVAAAFAPQFPPDAPSGHCRCGRWRRGDRASIGRNARFLENRRSRSQRRCGRWLRGRLFSSPQRSSAPGGRGRGGGRRGVKRSWMMVTVCFLVMLFGVVRGGPWRVVRVAAWDTLIRLGCKGMGTSRTGSGG